MGGAVDPVTLAVVSGVLDSSIREMTITMRRAAMSPVLAIGNDFSNSIFDGQARMVLQGQDQPVHLGAMIFACKAVAGYFGSDLAAGDVIYHNDPRTGGSHLQDMTLYKPVFVGGELAFWTVNRAHMDETGGPVPGGYNPTAEEIWEDTDGRIDGFVSGVGTGGTIAGVGQVLKERLGGKVRVVAVEPEASPVISGGDAGFNKIQGIGAGFVPRNYNSAVVDEVVRVDYGEAMEMSRRLAREEGIFCGISSGAITWAALNLAQELGEGKRVVSIICDFGERYLSHELFAG